MYNTVSILRFSLVGIPLKKTLTKLRDKQALSLANKLKDDLVFFTPKDTGRAKRGWEKPKKTRTGYTIQNKVPYIGVLDKGRHYDAGQMRGSKQAPKGMTRPALRKNKLK